MCVFATIGHRQQIRRVVLASQVLIGEEASVDTLAAGSVAFAQIAALYYEIFDHTVNGRALVVQFGVCVQPEAFLTFFVCFYFLFLDF